MAVEMFSWQAQRKNVPDVGIELGAACMASELASDRATAPGYRNGETGIFEEQKVGDQNMPNFVRKALQTAKLVIFKHCETYKNMVSW